MTQLSLPLQSPMPEHIARLASFRLRAIAKGNFSIAKYWEKRLRKAIRRQLEAEVRGRG